MGKLKRIRFALSDRLASLLGRADDLVPPRKLSALVGGGDFKGLGEEFFGYFTGIGGLKPDDRVLDVGCGCGRMAVPLMRYLSPRGSYEGFDVMQVGIDWCLRRITPRDPRFRFRHANIFNQYYNPGGKCQPTEYRFPYPDGHFDFVFLTSVFTHMLADDMRHYLAEIARVMAPGGRCLISYFILNPQSEALMDAGKSAFAPRIPRPDCVILREDKPEETVAYQESLIRGCFTGNGLAIAEPIRYGSWSGRPDFLTFQDLVVAKKSGGA